MGNKKNADFTDNMFYGVTNYIWYTFITNLYFLLTSFPLVLYFFAIKSSSHPVLMFILAIPSGPALTALFAVMGKLLREKDISPTTDFFSAYKLNFKQSITISAIMNLFLAVSYMDIEFFSDKNLPFIAWIFIGFMAIAVILNIYIYPLVSRFSLKSINVIKLSFYYSIKKIHITVVTIILIATVYFSLSTKIATIVLFFGASSAAWGILYLQKKIFSELEARFQ